MNVKIRIYEPGMCCPTGLCGPGINTETMRITTAIRTMEKNNIDIKRFNLTSHPIEFVTNKIINELLVKEREIFPVTLLNGEIVKKGNYPTNEELTKWTNIPLSSDKPKINDEGCCSGATFCSIDCAPSNNRGCCDSKKGCC